MVQVCDQPHPLLVAQIVRACMAAHLDDAYAGMKVGLAGAVSAMQGCMCTCTDGCPGVPGWRLCHGSQRKKGLM